MAYAELRIGHPGKLRERAGYAELRITRIMLSAGLCGVETMAAVTRDGRGYFLLRSSST